MNGGRLDGRSTQGLGRLVGAGFWRRAWHLRLRLWAALALGLLAGLATRWIGPPGWLDPALVAWTSGTLAYLVQIAWFASHADEAHLRQRAKLEDEGPPVIMVLVVLSVLASLGAIVGALGDAKNLHGSAKVLAVLLAGTTVACSWLLLQVTLALHYAHEFYAPDHPAHRAHQAGPPQNVPHDQSPLQPPVRGGLQFPGEPVPDYWDFIYMACIIGTSAQTADVSFTSRAMRRLGLWHSVLAFFFNTMVLALLINITASLL